MAQEIIEITLCSGTACFVMGGSELLLIEDELPEEWKDRVRVEASPCLGLCKDRKNGRAPFALVDGEPVANATLP